MAELKDIIYYLDKELAVHHIPDVAVNGLCIEGKQTIKKVGLVVDVTVHTIEQAIKENCDMIISHHALLWKPERVFTGVLSKRLKLLFSNDISLYVAHHPIDVHKKFSHSRLIANEIGLYGWSDFLAVEPKNQKYYLGVSGHFRRSVSLDDLKQIITTKLSITPLVYSFGKSQISNVAVVAGSAGSCLEEVYARGIDCLVTGELKESYQLLAKDLGITVITLGHTQSELIGMKKLSYAITKNFKIPAQVFIS